ncbi:uncharacterized protein [Apostichopus japonicus]|uniref:uncharacterized protein isoform X2 n=1 Tax=Stichopus japonicus TaxID=307972 RepID=UPI003AB32F05
MESVTFGKVFFLMLAVSIDSFAKQSSPHKYIVKRLVGSEVILNCSKIPQLPGNWKQNGETLYINRIPTKAIYRKTLILQDDYSLKIPFLKVNNEGNYTCVIDSRLAETYILGVEVEPLSKIIVNDDENITRAFLEHGAETSVKCMAVRSRPQVNLTYEIAHEDALKVNHNISSNRRDGHTYDTVLEVIFVPRRLNGTIKCVSRDQYSFPAQSIRVQYETYVVPTTHLLINNQETYNVVHVEMLATLSAVCSSFGARPVDELSWLINDVPANQLVANSTTRSLSSPTNEYTYDSVSFLTFRPKDKTGSVVCLSKSGVAGRERSVKAHYVTYDFGRFKVRLAELLTAEIILKLAMLFKFTPAENDELRHAKKSTGLLMVSFMAERGQIKPNDISPLLTALDRLGLQGLLSTLRSIFQGSEDKTYQFVRCLKSSYKQLYSKINPIPYIREKVYRVNEIFVEGGIEMHRRDNKDTGGNRMEAVKLKSYHDVFNDDIVSSKRILLEGDPGYGKSTFTLQAAYDWCNASESSPLKDVAIFILLPLRRLGGISLVCQAIKLMLMPGESKLTEEDIMEILRNSPGGVLVFDGYDEYPDKDNIEKSEILKIIAGNMFAKFKVITCTRSSYIPDNLDVETVNVRLTGFDDNARDEYISRAVAVNDNQEARRINGLLTNSPVLSDICQVPLFCVMFVHISYDSKHILSFASVTSFFRHILTCFYEHMRNKMGHARKRKDCYVIPHHPKLSKLLFDALTGKNQQIVWQKDMFKTNVGDGCYNELLSIGILLEEDILKINDTPGMAAVSVIERTTVVRFYHKLFAEWYAANYLSTCAGSMENEALSLQKEFEKINPVDLQFVFRFACGLNKKAFSRIIKYLKGIKDGQSFAILCFPEQVSEPDDEVAIVKDLLTGGVTIRSTDSRFLQRLTKQILDIAAKSDIPISNVCLNKSFKECEKDVIVLHSGLRLNQLLTVEKIHIETEQVNKEPRILTEEELTMIFRYGLRSKHLKDLSFDNCLLPPSIAAKSIPARMKSRDIKVLWRYYGYSLNLESGAWKVDDVDTVKVICTNHVDIGRYDSELRQRCTIQLLENASYHDIPIYKLVLAVSISKVDKGGIVIQSGLCLPTLSTLKKLSVVANLAELTEEDVIGLLNYGIQSRAFKELSFYQCKLPTSISPESIAETARSRNIKVLRPDTTSHLDLQSGKWKQAEDIPTITELCSNIVVIYKKSSQESQKSTIELLKKASSYDIPILGVGLLGSFNKVDGDDITLYSGLSLPILKSIEMMSIDTEEGREMNKHDVNGILNYLQHSQRFKLLGFMYCLLPPTIASSSLANLKARNVDVAWFPYGLNERKYLLDLQSGRWLLNKDPESFFPMLKPGEELTDADYANEVKAFRNRYRAWQLTYNAS